MYVVVWALVIKASQNRTKNTDLLSKGKYFKHYCYLTHHLLF